MIRKNYIFSLDTPDLCYLLGVIHGDGYVSKGGFNITVRKQDAPYLYELQKIIELQGWKYNITNRETFRLYVSSRNLSEYLLTFKNKGVWKFPENPKYLLNYIGGLIDTDGSIQTHAGIAIYQKHNGNIDKIIKYLNELNLKFTVALHTRFHKQFNKQIQTDVVYLKSVETCNQIVAVLRHPRKINALREAISKSLIANYGKLESDIYNILCHSSLTNKQISTSLNKTQQNVYWTLCNMLRKNKIKQSKQNGVHCYELKR